MLHAMLHESSRLLRALDSCGARRARTACTWIGSDADDVDRYTRPI